ncbi:MAG TPA: sensor histidine kinase [Ktedonobacterales bacterium]|nr:sensor histidine kinase [Ktedonobacterales bacterium]
MKTMLWFLRSFRKLQWRLTLSYLLVTLVVVLAVESVNSFTETTSKQLDQPATFAQSLGDVVIPQLAPYLAANPPDQSALSKWATFFIAPPSPSGQSVSGKYVLAVILNEDGQILASAPNDTNTMQKFFWNTQSQALIQAARASSPKTETQTARVRALGGQTLIALPIKELGVFFTVFTGPVPQPAPLAKGDFTYLLWINLSSEFPLLALAGAIGIFSGMLGSRSIRRPLRQITLAAEAWSQGDFSVKVQAAARDELGQLARDLNSMADQLQTLLTTRQELAVVEERHRLARDLHDSIKQQMFVITLLVGAAKEMVPDHPQAAQTLDEAVRLTGQAQQELTALIHELRPLALAGKGLSAALADLLTGWEQSTGIAAEAHLPDGLQAPLATEQALYRIAQEALNNVARHSGATEVALHLLQEPGRLTLRIQDNGRGFTPTHAEGRGQGLSNMRQRAEDVGGSLRMFSDAAGTCVEAMVPLALTQAERSSGDEVKYDPTFEPAHRG